jgi:hypothetical protein
MRKPPKQGWLFAKSPYPVFVSWQLSRLELPQKPRDRRCNRQETLSSALHTIFLAFFSTVKHRRQWLSLDKKKKRIVSLSFRPLRGVGFAGDDEGKPVMAMTFGKPKPQCRTSHF